jgi:hypothetical protein
MTTKNQPTRTIADVAVINASSPEVCSDDELAGYVPALQQQVSQHFAPFWGADAQLTFVPRGKKPSADAWWLVVLDNSDQAGALGYHDLTPAGLPIGKVFAATDKQYDTSLSVTISHELLEMLGDPGINMTASFTDDAGNTKFYAYEACDACEDDSYGYEIDGVLVTDFVLPTWFGGVESRQFDYRSHVKEPFGILPGGYIGVWTPSGGWTQITGSEAHGAAHRSRASVGSRRERRRTERRRWAPSTVWA